MVAYHARRLLQPECEPELVNMLRADPVTLMSLGRTGVDSASLQPRAAESFRTAAADAPATLRARLAQYIELRQLQLELVLADRQDAALALASELADFHQAQLATQRAVADRVASEGRRAQRSLRNAARQFCAHAVCARLRGAARTAAAGGRLGPAT